MGDVVGLTIAPERRGGVVLGRPRVQTRPLLPRCFTAGGGGSAGRHGVDPDRFPASSRVPDPFSVVIMPPVLSIMCSSARRKKDRRALSANVRRIRGQHLVERFHGRSGMERQAKTKYQQLL